jgi:hypothetical protein
MVDLQQADVTDEDQAGRDDCADDSGAARNREMGIQTATLTT